jgi:type III secretion protein J
LRRRHLAKQIVLLSLTLFLAACMRHELQTGLTEQDAQEIVVLLNENGIDASAAKEVSEKKGEEKWSVLIRGGDQNLAQAWRVLQENGLPREKDKSLEDVFSNSGMIPTATEEKARLLVGVSGEINRTLKSIAGVVDARVLVVLPDSSPLDQISRQSSALERRRRKEAGRAGRRRTATGERCSCVQENRT